MDSNFFAVADETKNEVAKRIKNGVQKYLIFIVLLFNVSLVIVSRLYRFGLKNPFSVAFFLELAVTLTTTMICYICFIPFGHTEEARRNLDFPNTKNLWSELSEKVRNGFLKAFSMFCEEQVIEEQNETKRLILCNETVIPYETYKDKYEKMNDKDLKKLLEKGELCKKEYKALLKANGYGFLNPTKVKKINPVIILSGTKKSSVNDAGRSDKSYTLRWLAARPFVMFIVAAIINSISTTFSGGAENVILDMLFSVFQIVVAAVFGYSAGVSDFKYNLDKINSRVIFLSLFCEKNQIQTKTPSK